MKGMITPEDVAAIREDIFSSLHCALPGIVESFDAGTRRAAIRPAVKRGDTVMPLLRDVPVFMPVPFAVNPGDLCLVVFADSDTDVWLESGEVEEPASARKHSLSDAFAFVGFQCGRVEGS